MDERSHKPKQPSDPKKSQIKKQSTSVNQSSVP